MSISNYILRETFYPISKTETDDGMGGRTISETIGTSFRGRLSSLTENEQMSNNKLTSEATHKLFCNYITIDPTYRITDSASSRRFEIKGIVNPSNMNHHLELYLLEID